MIVQTTASPDGFGSGLFLFLADTSAQRFLINIERAEKKKYSI